MRNLNLMDWERILNNCKENDEDIELLWIDDIEKYGLVIECDLLETFYNERMAYEFLTTVYESIERIPEIKNHLKDIINNKQNNLDECIESILEYNEMIFFEEEYIWGNIELVFDYDEATWKYIDLRGGYYDIDYELVNYMSRLLLDDIEKWQKNERAM
jgi:hypothetical protein